MFLKLTYVKTGTPVFICLEDIVLIKPATKYRSPTDEPCSDIHLRANSIAISVNELPEQIEAWLPLLVKD